MVTAIDLVPPFVVALANLANQQATLLALNRQSSPLHLDQQFAPGLSLAFSQVSMTNYHLFSTAEQLGVPPIAPLFAIASFSDWLP